jgi:flagellar motility protein MotE (MotC chaperone)
MRFGFAGAGLLVFLATVAAVFTGDDASLNAQAEEKQATEKQDAEPKEAAKSGESGERAPAAAKTENFEESSFGNAANTRLPEPAQVDDIRKQRELIEAKQKELATREAELAARERALDEEIKKLKDARDELVALDGARKSQNEEKVAKVVETIETMSPKASSAMIATLDEGLAVAAMSRIATPKLAKIMNLMEPAKSSRLTELLAGVTASPKSANRSASKGRTAASIDAGTATTNAEAPSAPATTKGGNKSNANQEQNNANAGNSVPGGPGAPEKGKLPGN